MYQYFIFEIVVVRVPWNMLNVPKICNSKITITTANSDNCIWEYKENHNKFRK